MEQHPIDSRFKNKLGDLNRQPSADTWARLQNQLAEAEPVQEKKKRVGMWYYAAATLTLLLLSVTLLRLGWLKPGQPELPQVAVNGAKPQPQTQIATVTKPEIPQNQPENATENEQKSPAENLINNGENQANITSETGLIAQEIAPKTRQNAIKKAAKTQLPTAEHHQVAQTSINPVTVTSEMLALNEPQQAATEPANELAGKPLEVIIKRSNPEIMLAANHASEDENTRPVRLKNILKQAKNLKEGNGLNLQEIGLDQNSRLAMETRNISEKFSKVLDL